MPRNTTPSYRHHKASGQAVVTLTDAATKRRKDVLLGPYNSPESRRRYAETLAAWEDAGRVIDGRSEVIARRAGDTVKALLLDYWKHEKARFGLAHDDKPRGHLFAVRSALRVCRRVCGDEPAAGFGPLRLRAVRDAMIAEGWTRKYVNEAVGYVVAAFRWGVSMERVPAERLAGLEALPTLRRGEQGVRDGGKTEPVAEAEVEAVNPRRHRDWPWSVAQGVEGHDRLAPMGSLPARRGLREDRGGGPCRRPPHHWHRHRRADQRSSLGVSGSPPSGSRRAWGFSIC